MVFSLKNKNKNCIFLKEYLFISFFRGIGFFFFFFFFFLLGNSYSILAAVKLGIDFNRGDTKKIK
jgi:hypothetical protein